MNEPLAASKRRETGHSNRSATRRVPAELIAACLGGDSEAQQELYALEGARIYRLMDRMVGRQDAADVTQHVFLQVFSKLGSLSDHSAFETWLWRVAVNEARQFLRKRRKHPAAFELPDIECREPEHAARLADQEILDLALQQLEVDLRSLFILREREGFSYAELAAILDVPEGTIGSRLSRARSELKRFLLSLGWEP